eukprot:CAMPEP_0195523518 /NCGR_PEP_ID=MMETSP0794_2-20130614/22792_1 /TAXON_ID=515487 /ORGANISM="Stephanopyxis turris, Strain CCMP 815" /LENGTH=113 /DNA_ID=CAMNT_0040653535 /DNA_START=48 /DNA_END=389 /DNA_ORIENTATION=+
MTIIAPTQKTVTLSISIPNTPDFSSSWNFNGQTITLSNIPTSTTTIKQLKKLLSQQLNHMPVNKMQFKNQHIGFCKDGSLLKDLGRCINEQDGDGDESVLMVDLVPKVRGGRK